MQKKLRKQYARSPPRPAQVDRSWAWSEERRERGAMITGQVSEVIWVLRFILAGSVLGFALAADVGWPVTLRLEMSSPDA